MQTRKEFKNDFPCNFTEEFLHAYAGDKDMLMQKNRIYYHTGNWTYAPAVFEEEDILAALSTARNIESRLYVWNPDVSDWDLLYFPRGSKKDNEECLSRYGLSSEQVCSLDCCEKSREDALFAKTDDYFYSGLGIIDLLHKKIICRTSYPDSEKLPPCALDGYDIYSNAEYAQMETELPTCITAYIIEKEVNA